MLRQKLSVRLKRRQRLKLRQRLLHRLRHRLRRRRRQRLVAWQRCRPLRKFTRQHQQQKPFAALVVVVNMKVTFSPLRFPKLTLLLQPLLQPQPQSTRRRQNLLRFTRPPQNPLRFTRQLRHQSLLRFILQSQNPFVALAAVMERAIISKKKYTRQLQMSRQFRLSLYAR